MTLELLADTAKLTLIVACLYYAFGEYVRRWRPTWSARLETRRVAILWLLVLTAFAIKVSEDAITGDSRPIDKAILLLVHTYVPSSLNGLFEAITLSGSFKVLAPLVAIATIVMLIARRHFEALLLAGSTIGAAAVVDFRHLSVTVRP